MIKLMALLKRRHGLSREDFIAYYEDRHAPLVKSLAPIGKDYRRNYVTAGRRDGREIAADADFDVISEVWFPDTAAYQAFAAAMLDTQIGARIVADEEQFLDRAASRIYVVDERRSPSS